LKRKVFKLKFVLLSVLAVWCSPSMAVVGSSGTVYYVCNNHETLPNYNGSDTNDGLSPTSAWKTYEKALQEINNLAAGDTLAFCRGGKFYQRREYGQSEYRISNTNSTAANPIVITSYVLDRNHASCYALPEINDHSVTYFNDPNPNCDNTPENCSGQPRYSTGPFVIRDSSTGGVHNEGLVIEQLIIKTDPSVFEGIASEYNNRPDTNSDLDYHDLLPRTAITIGHDYDNTTVQYVEVDGFRVGLSQIEQGVSGTDGWDQSNDHNTFTRLLVHNNVDQGFIGVGNDLELSEIVFRNNGAVPNQTDVTRYHHIYISKDVTVGGTLLDENTAFQNITVKNNAFYQSAIFDEDQNPLTPDVCGSPAISVHGAVKDVTVDGNLLWEDDSRAKNACKAIDVSNGYSYKHMDAAYNLSVTNNVIFNTGNTAMGCTFCDGAKFDSNIVINSSTPEAQLTSGPFAMKAIRIPLYEETDYDPCYEINDINKPNTLSVVENSVQNGLATDPDNIIGNSTSFAGTQPVSNSSAEKADGQWFNLEGGLLQWAAADGTTLKDKPFKAADVNNPRDNFHNAAYDTLNCNPKHVINSDNQTRSATISNNTFIFDAYTEDSDGNPAELSSKTEAIEVGDDMFKHAEIDINGDSLVNDDDTVDTYSVFNNKAYYSNRTRIEDTDCAADIHPTSDGVDVIDESGGNPNECIVYVY